MNSRIRARFYVINYILLKSWLGGCSLATLAPQQQFKVSEHSLQKNEQIKKQKKKQAKKAQSKICKFRL